MKKKRFHGKGVRGPVAVLGLAVALGLAAAQPASAQDWQAPCLTGWGDSPASEYCSGTNVVRLGVPGGDGPGNGLCKVSDSECWITVPVSQLDTVQSVLVDVDTEFTTEQQDWFWVEVDRMDDIDLCFTNTSGTWSMNLKPACEAGDRGSSVAKQYGLPLTAD